MLNIPCSVNDTPAIGEVTCPQYPFERNFPNSRVGLNHLPEVCPRDQSWTTTNLGRVKLGRVNGFRDERPFLRVFIPLVDFIVSEAVRPFHERHRDAAMIVQDVEGEVLCVGGHL